MSPTDYVWIAVGHVPRPIFHATDHDRGDVVIARGMNVGPVVGWALSRCGKPMFWLTFDAAAGRFYLGGSHGIPVQWRLLNTAVVRPCRRCWPAS